jgi:V8-like Glu-specific endopeptidase
MMVIMMMTGTGFAQAIDWTNFNSSLVIEVTRSSGVFTCSGVAIKDDVVLTAAHCLDGEVTKVRVSHQASYDPQAKFHAVESFELHPEYDVKKSNFHFDLAKIKLKTKLPASTKIMPIAKKDSDIDGNFFRLGFGARADKNIRTLVTPEFKALRPHSKTLELNDMYSYSGDSGGPIFLQRQGQMYLVAIHSTLSYGPEGKYSFNPLLAAHRSWINQ